MIKKNASEETDLKEGAQFPEQKMEMRTAHERVEMKLARSVHSRSLMLERRGKMTRSKPPGLQSKTLSYQEEGQREGLEIGKGEGKDE